MMLMKVPSRSVPIDCFMVASVLLQASDSLPDASAKAVRHVHDAAQCINYEY